MPESHPRAVFFDRDGVLNVDYGFVFEPSRLTWRPTAVQAVKWLNDQGVLVFVVTNQSGVARALYTQADVDAFHAHMQAELGRAGARIDAFRHCPHHPEASVPAFRRECDCRKPAPGMIRDLLQAYALAPGACHLFGDRESDLAAAAAAGVAATLVRAEDALLDLVQGALGD